MLNINFVRCFTIILDSTEITFKSKKMHLMLTEGIIRWVTLAIINHTLAESNNSHVMSLAVKKFLHKNINGPTGNTCVEGRSPQYPQESPGKNAGILVSACK